MIPELQCGQMLKMLTKQPRLRMVMLNPRPGGESSLHIAGASNVRSPMLDDGWGLTQGLGPR
jgi:hypothetical protein